MKKVIKTRKAIDRGLPVKEQDSPWPYVAGFGLFMLFLSLVLIIAPLVSRLSSTHFMELLESTLIPPITPTSTPAPTPMATLVPVSTQTPRVPELDESETIIAIMTGSVWVWDSAEGGEILSAAIPKDAEVVVVEYGLHRTHVIWQGGEARVEGWVNSNWVETIDG